MFKTIFIIFIILFIYFYIVSLDYKNNYKLIMLFGKKGSGKSTYLTRLAIKYNKLGYHVYSNSEIFNTYKLNSDWIGFYDFPKNSVLLVDEVGMIWDNRNFKSFKTEVRDFFKLQRHKNVIVYLASQSFDIDKKLRDLTDEMYLLTNYMGIFSVAKKINKRIAIHNASENNDGESFLTETYSFDLPFFWKITYIPRYVKYFNSFESTPLPPIKTDRYKYINENILYQETKYYIYLRNKIKNKIVYISNKYFDKKHSFKVSNNLLLFNRFYPLFCTTIKTTDKNY